jgi:hypothetical protein
VSSWLRPLDVVEKLVQVPKKIRGVVVARAPDTGLVAVRATGALGVIARSRAWMLVPQGAGLLLRWRHARRGGRFVFALDARFLGVDAMT